MSLFSWARFIVGIILSVEVIRNLLIGKEISNIATALAIIFLGLSALYFVEKIYLKT